MVNEIFNSRLVAPLKNLAKEFPEKKVLMGKNTEVSALELFNNSINVAMNLRKRNFLNGDTVALAVEPGKELLEVIYALLMLHAKIAIIDPEMGRENYKAKLNQLSPKWMFVDSRLLFMDEWPLIKKIVLRIRRTIPEIDLKSDCRIIKTGRNLPLKRKHASLFKLREIVPGSDLELSKAHNNYENIVVYTSGTLDVPKGVLHSDKSLDKTISLLKEIIDGEEKDIVGTYLPHFMLLGIASGLVVKIMKPGLNAIDKIKWINEEKINILFGPPSEWLPLILHCEKIGTKFPKSIKHLMLGSAPVHQGFLKKLIRVLNDEVRITCTYGMTEHLLVATADGREKVNYIGNGDLLGKIVSSVDVMIEADNEILVRSDQMFSRYYHLNEGSEWHHTGDLGKFDEQGNLVLLGRKKEMIIRKDFNIYPALYEGTIKKIPGINEAVFIGIYNEDLHDERVYLAIEGNSIETNWIAELLKKGEFSIDKQALPDVIISMKIPRKGRQDKVDRQAIVNYISKQRL